MIVITILIITGTIYITIVNFHGEFVIGHDLKCSNDEVTTRVGKAHSMYIRKPESLCRV